MRPSFSTSFFPPFPTADRKAFSRAHAETLKYIKKTGLEMNEHAGDEWKRDT